MTSIIFDSPIDHAARRERLFAGDLFVFSPNEATLAFVEHARKLIAEAFPEQDPELAQHDMEVSDYASTLTELKPHFIHHPESKTHIQKVLASFDALSEETYFEVPKLRSSTSDDYLTTGIAYAWHPHRDTWYSAPACQLNWWLPVFDITMDNCMAFHPSYFDRPLKNSSAEFNYYEWNQKHRGKKLAKVTKKDSRPLPRSLEPVSHDCEQRIVVPVGSIILFSGAHLHSSVPNTSGKTRFSIDFRTVDSGDLEARRGAPNVDAECTGTVIREFHRSTDFAEMPDSVVELYQDGTESLGPSTYGAGG